MTHQPFKRHPDIVWIIWFYGFWGRHGIYWRSVTYWNVGRFGQFVSKGNIMVGNDYLLNVGDNGVSGRTDISDHTLLFVLYPETDGACSCTPQLGLLYWGQASHSGSRLSNAVLLEVSVGGIRDESEMIPPNWTQHCCHPGNGGN